MYVNVYVYVFSYKHGPAGQPKSFRSCSVHSVWQAVPWACVLSEGFWQIEWMSMTFSPSPLDFGVWGWVFFSLVKNLHSHCILVLLSLQAAHSSTLLEYLFPFLSFLCSVWSFGSLFLWGWYQTRVLMHARLAMPQRHSPRPFSFLFYFIYNFDFPTKLKHSVLTLPYSLAHNRQFPRSCFPSCAGSVSASYRT